MTSLTSLALTDSANRNQFNNRGGTVIFNSVDEVFAVGVTPAAAVRVDTLEWATNGVLENVLLFPTVAELASEPALGQVLDVAVCQPVETTSSTAPDTTTTFVFDFTSTAP